MRKGNQGVSQVVVDLQLGLRDLKLLRVDAAPPLA
jgi:hypothetical protein